MISVRDLTWRDLGRRCNAWGSSCDDSPPIVIEIGQSETYHYTAATTLCRCHAEELLDELLGKLRPEPEGLHESR